MTSAKRVCVGLGNRFRNDDRAGLEVAERLCDLVPAGTEVVAIEGDPMPLLSILESAELVLVADAVTADAPPPPPPHKGHGTIHRFDASDEPVPGAVFGSSTHAFGLAETIELARALGRLNARVLVYGISGEDFTAGERLSPAVEADVETAIAQMLSDLSLPGRTHPSPEQEQSHA